MLGFAATLRRVGRLRRTSKASSTLSQVYRHVPWHWSAVIPIHKHGTGVHYSGDRAAPQSVFGWCGGGTACTYKHGAVAIEQRPSARCCAAATSVTGAQLVEEGVRNLLPASSATRKCRGGKTRTSSAPCAAAAKLVAFLSQREEAA